MVRLKPGSALNLLFGMDALSNQNDAEQRNYFSAWHLEDRRNSAPRMERRLVVGKRLECSEARESSNASQNGILRYSRLENLRYDSAGGARGFWGIPQWFS